MKLQSPKSGQILCVHKHCFLMLGHIYVIVMAEVVIKILI